MATKIKSVYVCTECGYKAPKWFGQCPGCGEWNTLIEEQVTENSGKSATKTSNIIIEAGESLLVIINHNWLSLEKQPYVKESATIEYNMKIVLEQAVS